MLLALILVTVYAIKYATESQVQTLKEEILLYLKYMQDQLSLVSRKEDARCLYRQSGNLLNPACPVPRNEVETVLGDY